MLSISDRDILSYKRSLLDIDGSKSLNEKLIKTTEIYRPDLIVLGHADLIKNETIAQIKKKFPQIKFIQWFLDRIDEEWKINKKRFLDKIKYMDASFCTTHPDILNLSFKKVYYIPNPSDASLDNLKIYNGKNLSNDVFFAMSHGVHRGKLKKGKLDKREIFIKLIKITPEIKFDVYGVDQRQPIWSDDFKSKLSNSKMAINLSQGSSSKYYSSDRIAQLMGNGLLTFIDKKTKLNYFFKNNEAIFYNSIRDLSKKIIFYNKNTYLRKKIAKRGRDKYHKYFNNILVVKFMLSKCFKYLYKNKKFLWEK